MFTHVGMLFFCGGSQFRVPKKPRLGDPKLRKEGCGKHCQQRANVEGAWRCECVRPVHVYTSDCLVLFEDTLP